MNDRQEASLRKKRKEKDEKLTKQAQQANRKQKKSIQSIPSPEDEESEEQGSGQNAEQAIVVPAKPKLDRRNLPAFLPAEYLSDTEEVADLPLSSHIKAPRKSNKIKFLDEKPPKDIAVGRTIFRVAETGLSGAVLAPKADKRAKHTKESWINGRKLMNGGIRKKTSGGSGGFFTNADKKRRKR